MSDMRSHTCHARRSSAMSRSFARSAHAHVACIAFMFCCSGGSGDGGRDDDDEDRPSKKKLRTIIIDPETDDEDEGLDDPDEEDENGGPLDPVTRAFRDHMWNHGVPPGARFPPHDMPGEMAHHSMLINMRGQVISRQRARMQVYLSLSLSLSLSLCLAPGIGCNQQHICFIVPAEPQRPPLNISPGRGDRCRTHGRSNVDFRKSEF